MEAVLVSLPEELKVLSSPSGYAHRDPLPRGGINQLEIMLYAFIFTQETAAELPAPHLNPCFCWAEKEDTPVSF